MFKQGVLEHHGIKKCRILLDDVNVSQSLWKEPKEEQNRRISTYSWIEPGKYGENG